MYCGQCYDVASVMSSIQNGVAKCTSDKEPWAVFTYCYGHSLNLAVGDTVNNEVFPRNSTWNFKIN